MCRHSVSHEEYLKAFSEGPMVFAGCKRVVAAHQAVLDKMNKDNTIISDEMVDFLRECARELNIRGISEQQLKQRFGAPQVKKHRATLLPALAHAARRREARPCVFAPASCLTRAAAENEILRAGRW